jgi:hypothetical protein
MMMMFELQAGRDTREFGGGIGIEGLLVRKVKH